MSILTEDKGVDRIPAQESRMSKQMEAEKYGNIENAAI